MLILFFVFYLISRSPSILSSYSIPFNFQVFRLIARAPYTRARFNTKTKVFSELNELAHGNLKNNVKIKIRRAGRRMRKGLEYIKKDMTDTE
jgi:hypothetical protein